MSLIINNNSMANTAARNLNTAYSDLTKSTERLSSGMRINSAADDAAGLAVREMMRAEVTTLNQGVRNANDAISMIQTADGALSVIDEKLIRMNELAEQAATGTYTDDQRAIIDQEYQTMAEEITRIADATDFNGTKLLDGSLDEGVEYEDENGMTQTGEAMTIHFGTGNDADEDKYDINIQDVSSEAMGLGSESLDYKIDDDGFATTQDGSFIYENEEGEVYIEGTDPTMDAAKLAAGGYEKVVLKEKVLADPTVEDSVKSDLAGHTATAAGAAVTVDGSAVSAAFDDNGKLIYEVGTPTAATTTTGGDLEVTAGGELTIDGKAMYATIGADGAVEMKTVDTAGDPVPTAGYAVQVDATTGEYTLNVAGEDKKILTTTASDGSAVYYVEDESENIPATATAMTAGTDIVEQNLNVAGDGSATLGDVDVRTSDAGDYALQDTTLAGTGGSEADASFGMRVEMVDEEKVTSFEKELGGTDEYAGSSIATQEGAEAALAAIQDAIEMKDKNRANLGAYENRLAATISNLEIQSENLAAAESRISDVDVATEMTEYTLRQTISQAATSMLAQANTLPETALQLIG